MIRFFFTGIALLLACPDTHAQCDTVYNVKRTLRTEIYYARPADAGPAPHYDVDKHLQQFRDDRLEVGRVIVTDCASLSAVDNLLDDLVAAYTNKRGAAAGQKRWLSVVVKYTSAITYKDMVTLLNRCNASYKVDIDLVANEIVFSLKV